MEKLGNGYTLAEEIAHVITHGAGVILSIFALSWMLFLSIEALDPWRIAASIVYGVSLIALFTASTLYHSFHSHQHRAVFELLDHCAIYLLIAGTYTPFLLVAMRTGTGWALFGAIWALATAGILTRLWLRNRFEKLQLGGYLLMGWLVVIALPQLIGAIGWDAMLLLAAGGICYTVGVVFYVMKRLPFNHAIWHVFVLAGGVLHFLAVILHVLPLPGVAING